MRIAIDASRTVLARRTGTERYALELTRALLALDQHDDFWLYFNQPPPADLFPAGPHWRARVAPLRRLWTHLALSRVLASDRPDVLFVPAHVLPLRHPPRSVVTIHDVGFRHLPRTYPPLALAYLELSTRWAAHRASRLIVPSRSTADDLQRCYAVSADRIRVIPEGVQPCFRPVQDQARLAEVRRRHRLGPEPYLLAVGTVQPRKNLPGLLQAFQLLLQRVGPACTLAVAGASGWGSLSLEAEARRLGLDNRVRWLGYVQDEDLPALYTGCLAFVLVSLFEGFGLPALEALACGAPVVASSTSSLPEVVGEAGLLADPRRPAEIATALERVVTDADLRARLVAAGPRRAASFTWERCARETLAVLHEA